MEANDRWWETLLAATCYWEVEPRQQSEIKFKTFGSLFFLHLMKQNGPSSLSSLHEYNIEKRRMADPEVVQGLDASLVRARRRFAI